MSRRSQAGRQSWSPRRQALNYLAHRGQRKRKTFTFEHLEDRFAFSVSTALPSYTLESLSSDTAEGAYALWMRELEWAAQQSSITNSAAAGPTTYSTYALPSDPLFAQQWHLLNTGQEVGNPDFQAIFGVAGEDINVVPAWNQGYTGAGVVVAVNDSGTQLFHPDLIANLHPTLRFNAISGNNNAGPNLLEPGAEHGTAVAGLIGATANNGRGGSGVAPGVSLVPVRLIGTGTTNLAIAQAFNYALQNGVDITNNSWGPADSRVASAPTGIELAAIRDSILFGRDGLGIIHVFASGNGGGPAFNPGFDSIGNWDQSNYDGYANSRYVISVTGVDHDGLYVNADGTFTSYPEAGANVLVAAPTGSNAALNIGSDTGLGSGIVTTDLVGDFGANAAPLPSGFDFDRDFLEDPDYMSRFNGTSAAAPLVSGVIALMLEANPNLSYRDVQEILVRSARQNAQFEVPESGGIPGALVERPLVSTWQVNQIGPFRDPDPWNFFEPPNPFLAVADPTADPNIEGFFFAPGDPLLDQFPLRSLTSHYEPQPGLFTNGAGYTVSQGYGVYSEMTGYGHGVIDAGLAVQMAEQWHTLGQNSAPERTYSTFVVQPAPQEGYTFPAAEKMADPPDGIAMIVPGGIGGLGGFIDYWNEYFVEDDPADPDDGPFSDDDPPANTRGNSYWQFSVPDEKAMSLEWVEVKISLGGPAEDLDFVRINLTSPSGTVSELNHYYADPEVVAGVYSFQEASHPAGHLDPIGDINTGGQFVWTFSTNRHWGESTKSQLITDPATGEPLMAEDSLGTPIQPFTRGWELHLENWSSSDYTIDAVEIIWHGKPIAADTQRVQGLVGIDSNSDELFNYSRSNTVLFDSDFDPGVIRSTELQNELDLTQEPFAENILVEAFRVVNGVTESDAAARFLTGADGNYYFDLVPGEYIIRASDPLNRPLLSDLNTEPQFARHFLQEWHITEDWFYASARDIPVVTPVEVDPLETPYSTYVLGDVLHDNVTGAPQKFLDQDGEPIRTGVKNLNFLIKQDAPLNEIVINGNVYADLNGNGIFDMDDTPAGGIFVYWDQNRDNVYNAGEQRVLTSEDPLTRGQYQLTIPASALSTYAFGIIPPSLAWDPTNPNDAVLDIFAGPGDIVNNANFFIDPPNDAFPPNGANEPGNILGVVYNDLNVNGVRNQGEGGVAGFRVFIDANENGVFDAGDVDSITASNGTFFFADVTPGLVRIGIQLTSQWSLTSPTIGFREVQLGPGGTVTGVLFGLDNLADNDWGDLPNSYNTVGNSNGPSHVVIRDQVTGQPIFYLGSNIDGEVDGQPTSNATGDDAQGGADDGVVIVSNNGLLTAGSNTLRVTVHGIGGMLRGWIDWNDNGAFDINELVVWEDPAGNTVTQVDLNPGTWNLKITAPDNLAGGPLAARFRWGEPNLGSTGHALFGEVEDYFLANSVAQQLVGDFDGGGSVDDTDYGIWRSTFGSTIDLRADANKNGVVDVADYVLWRKNMGASLGSGSSVASGSGSGSGPGTQPKLSQLPTSAGEPSFPAALQDWLASGGSGLGSTWQVTGPTASVGGSSTGSSAVVSSTTGPTVTSPVVEDVSSSDGDDRVTSFFDALALRSTTTDSSRLFGESSVSSTTGGNLLLLDQAWAEIDAVDTEDDSLLGRVHDEDDDSPSDLALAAIFEQEDNWWHAI